VNRRALVGRGIVGAIALNLYFFGLAGLPVVDAMLLNQTSPLFVLPLAALILAEPVSRHQLLMTPFAVIGVVLVMQPNFEVFNLAGLAALGSGLFSAFAYVFVRKLAGTDAPHTVVLYFTLFSTLSAAPFLAAGYQAPDGLTWLALGGVGLLSVAAQLLMTHALHHDTAGKVSLVGYLGVVFALLWDILFWQAVPGVVTGIGAVLVVGALIEIGRSRPRPTDPVV
jgi:drug/metabolite transporter (DMT)-like permease